MTKPIAGKVIDFIDAVIAHTGQERASITFHGGEPLLAPFTLWEFLLDNLSNRLRRCKLKLNVQSNLWAMDVKFAQLFRQYGVTIGTSIDGPREICDLARGKGYWERTIQGMAKAREFGLDVGGIATVTMASLSHWREIVDFYVDNNIGMNLHPACPALNGKDSSAFALNAEEYGRLLQDIYPYYVRNRKLLSISTLDNFCKGSVYNEPDVCTFRDCFGMFLAIAPDGSLYPCQRFCGMPVHALGNVETLPTLEEIYQHPNAEKMMQRELNVAERCVNCQEYSICKGGCYYNALAGGDGIIDPLCGAYKQAYAFVRKQILAEADSPENLDAIVNRPAKEDEHPLFRKGAYISLAKRRHPRKIADTARTILGLHQLAKANDPTVAAHRMIEQRYSGDFVQTERLMQHFHRTLRQPTTGLNKLFAHITFDCNLRCTHCYAVAGRSGSNMELTAIERLLEEAMQAGFPRFVVTGGEPLVHPNIIEVLKCCARFRKKGMTLSLRTNLVGEYTDEFMMSVGLAFDKIVVSVDGNQETHDNRRGAGTYQNVVQNLERYQKVCANNSGMGALGLACTMRSDDLNGEPGWSVHNLASQLGVKYVRFRPLLPLGRAASWDEPLMAEGLLQHLSSEDLLESEFRPITTCGIGQNIYVEPDGNAFPCYAYHNPHTMLGNVGADGLESILATEAFSELRTCTVDTLKKCCECEYRYLCGGACRAWGNEANQKDLYAAPPQCDHLKKRAEDLISTAREYLELEG